MFHNGIPQLESVIRTLGSSLLDCPKLIDIDIELGIINYLMGVECLPWPSLHF